MSTFTHTHTRVPFDAEPSVTLRNGKDAAETASASEAGIALKDVHYLGWDLKHQSFQDALAVVAVTSVVVAGGETYAVSVEVDDDNSFGAPYKVAEVTVTEVGQYDLHLSAANIERNKPDAKFMRVTLAAAGAGASIEYYAWIGKELS